MSAVRWLSANTPNVIRTMPEFRGSSLFLGDYNEDRSFSAFVSS